MITDRDKQILLHLERYKYATIEQLQKIFFNWQDSSYNIVRRRMNEIRKAGYVRVQRDRETNKLIYIWNDKKVAPPTRHRLILLDVLAKIHTFASEVLLFEIEKEWMDKKIRTDGLTVFFVVNEETKQLVRIHYFIEIQISNSALNLEKYDLLYESGEVQKYLGRNVFPRVLLISDRQYGNVRLKHTNVIKLNTRLDNLNSVILPPKLAE